MFCDEKQLKKGRTQFDKLTDHNSPLRIFCEILTPQITILVIYLNAYYFKIFNEISSKNVRIFPVPYSELKHLIVFVNTQY